MRGQVVKLDRGFPLVRLDDGGTVRCEHATALVKGSYSRAVIGDYVEVSVPDGHDKGIIDAIEPRSCEFVRKDPTERALPQVLAANFDRVFVAQPLADVNLKRLERELVLAHETGAQVTVILTKADLAESDGQVRSVRKKVEAIAGDVDTLVVSAEDPASVEAVRRLVGDGSTAVLIGKSGVGKSSLVNLLAGERLQETGDVRESDGKGRHTTVCAAWGCGTPTRASARRSPTSSSLRRGAGSAIAATRTSPAAPCARRWRRARFPPRGSRRTRSCAARCRKWAAAARRRAAPAARRHRPDAPAAARAPARRAARAAPAPARARAGLGAGSAKRRRRRSPFLRPFLLLYCATAWGASLSALSGRTARNAASDARIRRRLLRVCIVGPCIRGTPVAHGPRR